MNTMHQMNSTALELNLTIKTSVGRAVALSRQIDGLADKLLLYYQEDTYFGEDSEAVIIIGEIITLRVWRTEQWRIVADNRKAYARILLKILDLRQMEQHYELTTTKEGR